MSILTNGFHPTFESLSALADQGELDGSRTRVGRHVAHCARCREVVGEIRSYGEAVRDTEMPAAPAGLWARIENGLDTSAPAPSEKSAPDKAPRETPSPEHETWRAAPALRPTTHVPSPIRRGMRRGGIVLAAAAVVVAVLLVPTSKGDRLQASPSAGTWRFSPARPVPGSAVTVRFEPSAGMREEPALMMVGGKASSAPGMARSLAFGWSGFLDSLAVLTLQRDGSYAGRFVVPADFTAMLVRLTDLHGQRRHRWIMSPHGPVSRDAYPFALLVAGDARGEPSLASLTAALELWSGQPFETYVVADTLIKYFPGEPIGYASDHHVAPRRLLDDLIAYFKRGERQYVKFDQKFMAQPEASADHEIAMIAFANRIDEPGEVRKWTMRLVREHGDDPRALYFYESMLDGMLSRNGTVDSVRAALPLADTLWERNGHALVGTSLGQVALTVHDTAAYHRWGFRTFASGVRDFRGYFYGLDSDLLREADVRAVAVPALREKAAASCELPRGKYSLWDRPDSWRLNCERGRAATYAALSYAARLDGRPAAALAFADSSEMVYAAEKMCVSSLAHRRRGEALLALHDTAAAIPELAKGIGYGNWQAEKRRDALGAHLRTAISRERWNALVQQAGEEMNACSAESNRRDEERRKAEAQAEAQADK